MRDRAVALAIVASALFIGVCFTQFPKVICDRNQYDDSYVTYRYAANLAGGRGLVFNEGERVNSASSLLYTVLLAGLYAGGLHDLERAGAAIGVASGVAILWLVAFAIRRITGRTWMIALFLIPLAIGGSLAGWAVSGMETALYSLLVTAFVCSVLFEKWMASLPLIVACVLCRPEGVLLVVAAAIGLLLKAGRRVSLEAALVAGAGAAAALLTSAINLSYYGSLLPHALVFKRVSWNYSPGVAANASSVFAFFACFHLVTTAAAVALVGSAARRLRAIDQSQFRELFVSAYLVFSLAALVIGPGSGLCRYAVHLLPVFAIAGALYCSRLLPFNARFGRAIAGAALVVVSVQSMMELHRSARFFAAASEHQAARRQIGKWIDAHVPRDRPIASSDIGSIAYHALSHRFIDVAGLVSKEPVSAAGEHDWSRFEEFLARARPEYVADTRLPGGAIQALEFLEWPERVFRGLDATGRRAAGRPRPGPPILRFAAAGGYEFVLAQLLWEPASESPAATVRD
jgi:hypothetical protein